MLVLVRAFVSELTYLVDIKSKGINSVPFRLKMNVLTAVCLFVNGWLKYLVMNEIGLFS
jgi:hypothetical protein